MKNKFKILICVLLLITHSSCNSVVKQIGKGYQIRAGELVPSYLVEKFEDECAEYETRGTKSCKKCVDTKKDKWKYRD